MRIKTSFMTVIPLILLFGSCKDSKETTLTKEGAKTMKITSPVFVNNGMIPMKYTCDGDNISPPLQWEGIPDGTKSIALVCDDPDAPMGTFVHWVLYNLPPVKIDMEENIPAEKTLADGSQHGTNDFGKTGYGGPCPPSGTHHYYFKIYALDTKVNLTAGATKSQLLKAIEKHVLAQGELVGKYKRQ